MARLSYHSSIMDTLTLSTKEAAAWTGTSAEIIRRMIRDGRLPAVPVGRGPRSGYRIAAEDLTRITRPRKRPLGSQRSEVESGQFLPFGEQFLPTLPLPDLIRYAETLQVLTQAALAEARRKLSEEVLVE